MTHTPTTTRQLGIADEDDLIALIHADDLTDALAFLRDTIRSHGTEDIAAYLTDRRGAPVSGTDVTTLAVRLNVALLTLEPTDTPSP